MTVAGADRQSKVRQNNTVVDATTLQAHYDRLWLHVRVIYVLLAVLTASCIFDLYYRQFVTSDLAPLDAGVACQNRSSQDDGVTEVAASQTLPPPRRRRSTSASRHRQRPSRRLRAASDAAAGPPSWLGRDDSKHDGLWMTLHSKIPVRLSLHRGHG